MHRLWDLLKTLPMVWRWMV